MNWGEINDWGQIVGYSEMDAVDPNGEDICGFGTHQIVGTVGSADGKTQTGALWQNDTLIVFGLLPGDFGGIASRINDKGQVVGSNWDSKFDWSHAFIWHDNVMTDLNTLIPASSNLYLTMANKINERGQIGAMAIVESGRTRATSTPFC